MQWKYLERSCSIWWSWWWGFERIIFQCSAAMSNSIQLRVTTRYTYAFRFNMIVFLLDIFLKLVRIHTVASAVSRSDASCNPFSNRSNSSDILESSWAIFESWCSSTKELPPTYLLTFLVSSLIALHLVVLLICSSIGCSPSVVSSRLSWKQWRWKWRDSFWTIGELTTTTVGSRYTFDLKWLRCFLFFCVRADDVQWWV